MTGSEGTRNTAAKPYRRYLQLAALSVFAVVDALSLALSAALPTPAMYSDEVWMLLAVGRSIGLFVSGYLAALLIERRRPRV